MRAKGDWTSNEPRLEETKRVARVLRIVQLISAQPRAWTRRRLSDEFELSARQIDYDLQLIRHGLRYELCRGRTGYYFTRAPVVKPLELSIPEALALALAAQQARDTGTVDGVAVAGALTKLENGLPSGIVPYLRRTAYDQIGTGLGSVRERGPILSTLKQGFVEGRQVSIRYTSASRGGVVSERTIAPYHLLPYNRSWIVIAHDSLRREIRMFNVDRITHCQLTDVSYAIPDDFDVASFLAPAWGLLRGEDAGPVVDIVLRFSPRASQWVRDMRWHLTQEMRILPDGALIMSFHCGVTPELVRWVLSYGSDVRVTSPSYLRDAVLQEARRVLDDAEGESLA